MTVTSNVGDMWSGLRGRITSKMIEKIVDMTKQNTYWICGPSLMVNSIENSLDELGATPKYIRSEKFSGY